MGLYQNQINEIFQGIQVEIWDYYAQVMNMLFLCVFLGRAIPLGIPITIFGMFNMYWAHKYSMLRLCRIPPKLGLDLSYYMTNLLDWIPLIMSVSSLFFQHQLYDRNANNWTYGFIGISILYIWIPSTGLNKKMFKLGPKKMP